MDSCRDLVSHAHDFRNTRQYGGQHVLMVEAT